MTAPIATGIAMPSILQPINPDVYAVLFAPASGARNLGLSDQERLIMTQLAGRLMDGRYQYDLRLAELYRTGQNIVPSLGISIPPELEMLRGVLGWCEAGIVARSERLNVQGFRMPGQTTVDSDLQEWWQRNNFDAESILVHDAAMTCGRSYVIVGVNDDGSPLYTPESATNLIGSWDIRTRKLSAAYQSYLDVDPASETYLHQLSTLYTQNATIQLVNFQGKGWQVQERNDHNMGIVPVVQFAANAAIHNRLGSSLMSSSWRNTQDRACRQLVRLDVVSEFFAAPKVWVLGTTEESFQKKDGSLASAWETFIGRLSAVAADANGNLPQIVNTQGSPPDGLIASIDHSARIMSGHTCLPPDFLGIYSQGNPSSADAIRMSDFRLKTAADRLSVPFGNSWEEVQRLGMLVTGGEISDDAYQMETDWGYTGISTPNADAQTVTLQIGAEMIPADSDDALAACGWTPVQRQRIAADRARQQGLDAINSALAAFRPPTLVPGTPEPGQPLDGEQPQALAANQMISQQGGNASVSG